MGSTPTAATCRTLTGRGPGSGTVQAQTDPRRSYFHSVNLAVGASWSPCGRYLLTRSAEYSRPLRLYDGCKKEFLGVIGHEPDCNSVTWSPDGMWLATAKSCCDWPPLAIWHIEQIETCSVEKRVELDT